MSEIWGTDPSFYREIFNGIFFGYISSNKIILIELKAKCSTLKAKLDCYRSTFVFYRFITSFNVCSVLELSHFSKIILSSEEKTENEPQHWYYRKTKSSSFPKTWKGYWTGTITLRKTVLLKDKICTKNEWDRGNITISNKTFLGMSVQILSSYRFLTAKVILD